MKMKSAEVVSTLLNHVSSRVSSKDWRHLNIAYSLRLNNDSLNGNIDNLTEVLIEEKHV